MMAETREQVLDESELMNDAQKYLRQEFSAASLRNPAVYAAALERLMLHMLDWGYRHGCDELIKQRKYDLAENALGRFVENWEHKVPGEDDRGRRLGRPAGIP